MVLKRNKAIFKKQEHNTQNAIIRYLLLKKFLVIRYNSGSVKFDNFYTKFYTIGNNGKSSGHPDLVFFKNGFAYFVEVKSDKGKLNANQTEFKKLAETFNMNYLVINDFEQIKNFIENLGE